MVNVYESIKHENLNSILFIFQFFKAEILTLWGSRVDSFNLELILSTLNFLIKLA